MMLHPDQQESRPAEVRLTDETIDYLESRITAAVGKAFREALTPEVARGFWQTGFDIIKEQATMGAGDFVLSGLWAGIKRLLWVVGIALALYATGGWAALKGFLALAFSKG